ncbi:monovalent cation/H(+) antiporter subunit G [Caldithrix abyssi]|uniref:Monovalent cation/proton antiporter, MnhG/PhaG subunit n=1 Tax=Caldithrix abyssi DSM 13497 TaxID=880073 RepID=H1XUS7_CALAY|nr:monovalent cation/H(+) antiporter subunit G [Caldithrix abyssi]APF17530.1 multicomponent Na+:H+ antiporter subunit G [Caldithrix abyssi DSM 13497]EHO41626.1 monovalent cation/proton antiporter, MnhG/PhaG subunit [Caldithrix abyssi DSM 13497]
MEAIRLIGALIALVGSLFLFLGALGILRMPDLYNRMQAGTKSTTLGSILTLLGIGIYHLPWFWQTFILVAFLVTTNPLSSHALARAAHFRGIPLTRKTVEDRLSKDEKKEKHSTTPEAELL